MSTFSARSNFSIRSNFDGAEDVVEVEDVDVDSVVTAVADDDDDDDVGAGDEQEEDGEEDTVEETVTEVMVVVRMGLVLTADDPLVVFGNCSDDWRPSSFPTVQASETEASKALNEVGIGDEADNDDDGGGDDNEAVELVDCFGVRVAKPERLGRPGIAVTGLFFQNELLLGLLVDDVVGVAQDVVGVTAFSYFIEVI